ncbi:hypothetical protein DSM100688_1331 [Bifidobacterium ramosum]|uniref:DUF3027 domain-containing protein n=1 Tax=Bifidobacterium ramosum TaxID=1798158 RepID=A0A6L4WZN0_9BIFI|nr:DUF3027 domain-containing protein [Bifidobacterium ramosum]KAB8287864.1 hypothetical protein DSM100688_1331 [Bifidobacterium ramosum]NEG71188.1 DUF3027 domain-containing protein [Bifidobacterium ramosum]
MPETTLDPTEIAQSVAVASADAPEQVGAFVTSTELGDGVTDFRFDCLMKGYEGWQWSVTLFHDVELDRWTVDETSLVPTDAALRPPAWVPWKDRLEPTDLSVTDSIGTDPDDPRIEDGFRETDDIGVADDGAVDGDADGAAVAVDAAASAAATSVDAASVDTASADTTTAVTTGSATANADGTVGDAQDGMTTAGSVADTAASQSDTAAAVAVGDAAATDGETEAPATTSAQDVEDAVKEFDLSRRHVLSPLGRAQAAKRWYEGQHGPKSLSTKTADGNVCANCGFFIQLKGELNMMFGVCANKWSPDDGRVVSVDHGCGEHSEIDPPEPTHLWIQSKPAYDDLHIDVVEQAPREERGLVELIERLNEAGIKVGKGVIVLKSQLPE